MNVKTAVSSFLEFFSGIPTLPTRRTLAAVELAVMLHLNDAPSRKPHTLYWGCHQRSGHVICADLLFKRCLVIDSTPVGSWA